jgi:hypothetical protein
MGFCAEGAFLTAISVSGDVRTGLKGPTIGGIL